MPDNMQPDRPTAEAQQWTPPENIHDIVSDQQAPTDHLHNYAHMVMTSPLQAQQQNKDRMEQLATNPKLGPHTIKDMYNHYAAPGQPLNSDVVSNLVNHPAAPAEQIEDYLKRTNDKQSGFQDRVKLGKRPGVSQDLLEELTHQQIQDPEFGLYGMDIHDLKPDFAMKLLAERPIPEPVSQTMTSAQKLHNQKVNKIDKVIAAVMAESTHHTPATLQQAVDTLNGEPPVGASNYDWDRIKHDLVENQKNLTSSQLERLFVQNPETGSSINEAIMKHPNVDPTLLSRTALDTTGGRDAEGTVMAARSNPALPRQTIDRILQQLPQTTATGRWGADPQAVVGHDLLGNPSLKPEDLKTLYDKGYSGALMHDNAPTSLLDKYWQDNGKSTDAGRKLLSRSTLPENILKDMVNHKNQNLALDALDHKSVNENVLATAAARKAPAIADKASKNPLVVKRFMTDRVKTGKMKASEFLFAKDSKGLVDQEKLPELYQAISDRYADTSDEAIKRLKETPKDFWRVKQHLVMSHHTTAETAKLNQDQIVDAFLQHVKPTDYENLTDRNHPVGHALGMQIRDMAVGGNEAAQNALLERPQLLSKVVDTSKPAFSSQWLDKAYEKIQQNPTVQVMRNSWNPQPSPLDLTPALFQMVENPNASNDLFEKISTRPDFLKQSDHYKLTTPTDGNATVFDQRYSQFPDDKKRASWQRLFGAGPDGALAGVASLQAPKDLWRQAVLDMNHDSRRDFFSRHDVVDFAGKGAQQDTTIMQDALRGHYNWKEGRLNGSFSSWEPQKDALSSLRPGAQDDAKLFDALDFMKNGQDEPPNDEQIYNALDKQYFTGPDKDRYIDAAYRHGSSLGSFALARSILPPGNHIDRTDVTPETLKTADTLIHQRFGADPEAYGQAWLNMLINKPIMGSSYGSNANPLSALLGSTDTLRDSRTDFLTDLQSKGVSPELAEAVKEKALTMGLISKDKVATLSIQDPTVFDNMMQGLQPRDQAQTIQSIVKQGMTPVMAKTARGYLTNNSFNPKAGKHLSMNTRASEQYKTSVMISFKHGSMEFVNAAMQAGDHVGVGEIVQRLTNNRWAPKYGGLTEIQKKDLLGHILTSIKDGPYPEEAKNLSRLAIFNAMNDQLDAKQYKLIPKSLMTDISRSAIKINDIETLLALAENANAPTAAIKQIAKLAEAPDKLNDEQLGKMVGLIRRKNTSLQDIKKIYGVASNRLAQTQDLAIKHNLFSSMRDMAQMADGSDNSIDRRRFAANYFKSAVQDPDYQRSAALALYDLTQEKSYPAEDKKDAFQHIPSDAQMNLSEVKVDPQIINDPQVLQQATHGWKLAAMMNSFGAMDADSAAVLISRIVSMDPADLPIPTGRFAYNVTMGGNASDEDVVKAVRFAGPDATHRMVTSLGSEYLDKNRLLASSLHAVLPIAIGDVMDSLEGKHHGPQEAFGPQHLIDIRDKAAGIAHLIGQLPDEADANVPQDRQDKYDEMAEQVYGIADKMMATKWATPGTAHRAAMAVWGIAKHVAATERQHNEDDKGLRALRLASNARNAMAQYNQSDTTELGGERLPAKDFAAFATGWNKNSIMTEEADWDSAFQLMPELAFALDQRKGPIPPGAIMAAKFPDEYFHKDAHSTLRYMHSLIDKIPEQGRDACTRKIVDASLRNGQTNQYELGRIVSTAMAKSPGTFDSDYLDKVKAAMDADHWKKVSAKALSVGVGGVGLVKRTIHGLQDTAGSLDPTEWSENHIGDSMDSMTQLARSPLLDQDDATLLTKVIMYSKASTNDTIELASWLAQNHAVPPTAIDSLVKHIGTVKQNLGSSVARALTVMLINNPNIERKSFFDLYNQTKDEYPTIFKAGGKFHPALTNSRYGGDLFRSLPQQAPVEAQNINQDQLMKSFEYSVGKNRIKEAMQHIPPEGIVWGQFKKLFPKGENWPEVKQMFMAKANKPLLPEEAIEAMKRHEGKAFHLTYSSWDGAQRHTTAKNLVVQLNTSQAMEQHLTQDPKLWNWFQFVQKSANHTHGDNLGGHPVTPHIASWIRVDTSKGKEGWVVEEFQSDFGARLYDELNNLKKQQPQGADIEGQHYSVEEMERYSKQIEEAMGTWYEASMHGIEQLAKQQGAKQIFIHGEDVRAKLSGMTKGQKNPVWMQKMYNREPPKYGYEKCDYTDYPSKSTSFLEGLKTNDRQTWCWRKRLT